MVATLLMMPAPTVSGGAPFTPVADGATPATSSALTIDGDRIVRLVADPAATGPLLVVGAEGLYASADGGETWTRSGPVPPAEVVVVAGDDPAQLLAGGGAACADDPRADPVWRSTDGGATWEESMSSTGIRPLALWSAAAVALGADCAGLRVSANGGQTWTTGDGFGRGAIVTSLAVPNPVRPAAALAVTSGRGSGALRAADLTDPAAPVLGAAVRSFAGTGRIAALGPCRLLGLDTGADVSTDESRTWTTSRAGLEDVTVSVDPERDLIPEDERARGYGITAVAFGADCERQFAGSERGLFASADGGAIWRPVPGADAPVRALAVGTGRILVETGDGVVVVPIAS